MNTSPRMSRAKVRVLDVLLDSPSDSHWGYDLMKKTNLSSGTLYPMLAQFEGCGWVKGKWEMDKGSQGGPPRRAYRLTGQGRREAPLAVEAFLSRKRYPKPLPRPGLRGI